ncbi:MAG: Zn-dependent hydrolase [Alphaproteobacteria bacterium]
MSAPRGKRRGKLAGFDPRSMATGLFDELRRQTADTLGVTRESYGKGEQAGLNLIEAAAREHGLKTETDAAANLIVTLPGSDPGQPAIACGSHIDSVPLGGNFDGAAGVIAGLIALARMRAQAIVPPRTVKLFVLRGEESAWYGKSFIGSSALFGLLTPADLAATHRDGTKVLRDAMKSCGAGVARIAKGERLLDPASLAAYLELHIEQGPVMVARDFPTAIVTGIRGCLRHRAMRCQGEAGHSGAVPRWLRRDALFATAELIANLDEHWRVLLERGLDLVVTCGIIGTNPDDHSMSRIPGEVTFSFEVRSQSLDTLEAFYHVMQTECRQIEKSRKVRFEFDRRVLSHPARMDEGWVKRLQDVSSRLGLPTETIPSGAGHDAAIFANAGIPSGMIFVRNQKGSHNPDEAMDINDFMKGAEILYHALLAAD